VFYVSQDGKKLADAEMPKVEGALQQACAGA
jgi:hypothetical protein